MVSVSPARVDDEGETESRYPFIHIEFNSTKLTPAINARDTGEDKDLRDSRV